MSTNKRYGRQHSRVGLAIAAACALVALAGFGGFAAYAASSDPAPTTQAPSTTVPDVTEMEIPEGKVPVASHEGGIAGFVDAEAEASPDGYPPLDLSTETPVNGLEVTDAEGVLVGYFIERLGFVDLATAETPGAVDALIADTHTVSPELQEQQEAFEDRIEEETGIRPGEG